jgi:hypothetical protein
MNLRFVPFLALCSLAACATPPPNQVPLPATPPAGEPANMTGMDASSIRVAFGTPQFVRKDGQIEMWRYDGASCKAFFFLYPNGTSMAVKHVETMPHNSDSAADPNCLQSLRATTKVS